MREYKTQATALKHIRAGENFTNKVFGRYWTDREVCMEALAHHPSRIYFVMFHNPDIEWDSEFISAVFLKAIEVQTAAACVNAIGKYLPPEITDSKAIALRVVHESYTYFRRFMAPNLLLDEDVFHALNVKLSPQLTEIHQLSSLAIGGPGNLISHLIDASPNVYWSTLKLLRNSRSATASICAHFNTFRVAFDGLDDDEEFILEVLKNAGSKETSLRGECSYRIRKATRDKDFINYLETVVQANRLDALLPQKTSVVEPQAKRLKV